MRILLDECLPKRLKRDLTGQALLTLAQVDFVLTALVPGQVVRVGA